MPTDAKQNLAAILTSCQNEFASLELELSEMAGLGPMTKRELKQRLDRLLRTKQRLIYLQSLTQDSALLQSNDEIPVLAQKDRRCQNLTEQYYQTILKDLRKFQDIASYLKNTHRKTCEGSISSLFINLILSKLRRKLLQFEQILNQKKLAFADWIAYSRLVEKACSPKYAAKDTELLPHFKRILQKWDTETNETANLRAQVDFESGHTKWLEQWLAYQEQRLKAQKPKTNA